MFLIPVSPSVLDIKSSQVPKLLEAQTRRIPRSSRYETGLVRGQLRRIDRQQMFLENERDDQEWRREKAAHRAPQPGPERQRQEHGERIQFQSAADNGRGDK